MRPEDSLDIIANMMSQTRRNVIQGSYWPFLLWGWSSVVVGLATYVAVSLTADPRAYLLWLFLPVIGCTGLACHINRRQPSVRTSISTSLHSIWKMLTIVLVCFSVTSYLVHFNVLFFILLILSVGCYVTGAIIAYPLLRNASVAGFLIAASLWFVGGPKQILVFLIAIVAMMIIPGYIMKQDLRNERT